MDEFPQISSATINDRASESTIERGVKLFDSGFVSAVVLRGRLLTAEVDGSGDEPYDVMVRFDDDGITSAECNCPFTYSGDCKHIVATLLHYINDRDNIEQRPAIEDLIVGLAEDQLKLLALHLVSRRPAMMNSAENFINRYLK